MNDRRHRSDRRRGLRGGSINATISGHIRANVVGYVAVFIALSGTAYAVDGPLAGQNTVGTADIINGEVASSDLAASSVGSGKLADRQVKNADLSLGASSSNTIADGGVRSVDVQNDGLSGADVKGLTGDDVKDDALTGGEIDEDTLVGGPTNPTGPAGGDLDGTYPDPQIAAGAVGSSAVAANSLTGADIADTSSLTGFEIDELSLAKVPAASNSDLLGGFGPSELSSFGDSDYDITDCGVEATIKVCASVTLNLLPAGTTSDVLLIGGGSWFNGSNAVQDQIFCELTRDGDDFPNNPAVVGAVGSAQRRSLTVTGIAQDVPSGVRTFELMCSEPNGEVDIGDRMLSAVVLR